VKNAEDSRKVLYCGRENSQALCTFQGKVLSPAVAGVARRLSGKEARRARARLRVGFIGWMWNIIFSLRYPGDKTAVYEVSPVAEPQTSKAEEEEHDNRLDILKA